MPRRYHHYAPEFQVLNVMSTAGASILAVGYVLPLVYLIWSLGYGKRAGPNPWKATGLEWQTASPPPPDNFDVTPDCDRGAVSICEGGERCRLTTQPLAHHFADLEQQHEVAVLGMWIFLATEADGLRRPVHRVCRLPRRISGRVRGGQSRAQHLVRRDQHGRALEQQFDDGPGRSSTQVGRRNVVVMCLALTAFLGTAFLVIKGFEYHGDYVDGLVPGMAFNDQDWLGSEPPLNPGKVKLFLLFYYTMTGLHGIHLIIGIVFMTADDSRLAGPIHAAILRPHRSRRPVLAFCGRGLAFLVALALLDRAALIDEESMNPMTQPRNYVLVFVALLALTAATVGLAYVDLGSGIPLWVWPSLPPRLS